MLVAARYLIINTQIANIIKVFTYIREGLRRGK